MTSAIDWDPVFPMVPLFIAGLVVLAFLIYIEWRRRQRFRTIRIICQVLVVVSLLGLLLRPAFPFSESSRPVVLLTPGFKSNDVDSLLSLHRDLTIVATNDSIKYHHATRSVAIRDLSSMTANPLWIAGEGLLLHELAAFPLRFHFLPPRFKPDGIIGLNYKKPIVAATQQSIAIEYHNPNGGNRTIRLTGPGGLEDSVRVQRSGEMGLTLQLTPKVEGTTMYKLEETDSVGSIFRTSQLPIYVEKMKTLNVLIVTDHPSFEVRYLKNFFADRGHRVAFRSRVSKGRFHQEFANRPRESLELLSSALLSATDIVLLDHGTYLSLPALERHRIERAADDGLGVLLLSPLASNKGQLLAFKATSGPDTIRVNIGGSGFTLPVSMAAPAGNVAAVVTTTKGQIVSGCRCEAGRKIGFQLLGETYQLGLQNKTASYAALWTPLIDKVSRTRQAEFSIALIPSFPVFSNVPSDIRVMATNTTPTLTYDSMLLPLAEDTMIDDVWHGRIWASGNRWHSMTADSTIVHFLDLPDSEWQALRITQQINANRAYVIDNPMMPPPARKPIPLLFFILFVIASGTLWLIPKI
jgi:hypothetical protein